MKQFILAILMGYILIQRRLKKLEYKSPHLMNLVFVGMIFGLIGTKLSHYIFWNIDLLIQNPLIVITGAGGASITGGLYLGMLSTYIYGKIKKMDFYRFFGIVSPVILFAQAVGRIGCFLNGDAHGIQTDLP